MRTMQGYEYAKATYESIGVDVEKAIETLEKTPVSIHCWQGDDVVGFEDRSQSLTGGIQTTGNHPGKARNAEELRQDIKKMLSYIPGANKISLHASYLETGGKKVDRNEIEPEHFDNWIKFAKENEIGLDFNATTFSHPLGEDGYTLCNQDKKIRDFWIDHIIRSRKISDYLGEKLGKFCVNNIWIHDGEKEVPIDTLAPRQRLKDSLDEIFAVKFSGKNHIDSLESKLFGIGSESYVPGSNDFYTAYVAQRDDVLITLDTGHFHPTEYVSAKLSALSMFVKGMLLHVSRPVRWDSDHVVAFDDETQALMREIIKNDLLSKVYIATDYFDASINRIIAWVTGVRNTKKALLAALLMPVKTLKELETSGDKSSRLAVTEELKTMPFGAIWDYICEKNNVAVGMNYIKEIMDYEKDVLLKR